MHGPDAKDSGSGVSVRSVKNPVEGRAWGLVGSDVVGMMWSPV